MLRNSAHDLGCLLGGKTHHANPEDLSAVAIFESHRREAFPESSHDRLGERSIVEHWRPLIA